MRKARNRCYESACDAKCSAAMTMTTTTTTTTTVVAMAVAVAVAAAVIIARSRSMAQCCFARAPPRPCSSRSSPSIPTLTICRHPASCTPAAGEPLPSFPRPSSRPPTCVCSFLLHLASYAFLHACSLLRVPSWYLHLLSSFVDFPSKKNFGSCLYFMHSNYPLSRLTSFLFRFWICVLYIFDFFIIFPCLYIGIGYKRIVFRLACLSFRLIYVLYVAWNCKYFF